jgi:oligopeptide/dipeptide ABC transporter ATP-binding protein
MSSAPLLEVKDLSTTIALRSGPIRPVDNVSLRAARGEIVGIVGESGSGKTMLVESIMGIVRHRRNVSVDGRVLLNGRDLVHLPTDHLRRDVWGAEIAMVFQNPMTSLNPVRSSGFQLIEAVRRHNPLSKRAAAEVATELMTSVGIPQPRERLHSYPHQLSGGMRQRVMIAMALAGDPSLLLADEPTTALDVTIQAQILALLLRLSRERSMGVVFITHDLGVVAEVADQVMVMYAGRIVESAPTQSLFERPLHPYTWGLLGSSPSLETPKTRRLPSIPGLPPALSKLPGGCKFRARCKFAFDRCTEEPPLAATIQQHADRCWLSDEDKARLRPLATQAVGVGGT